MNEGQSKQYRDNLADKLKDIRNNPELENAKTKAFEFLEKEKENEKYKKAFDLHQDDIKNIINEKNLDNKVKLLYVTEGDLYLKKGLFEDAVRVYKKGGMEITKKKFIEAIIDCYSGDKINTNDLYFLKKAGIEISIPKEKYIELGDIAVKKANLNEARHFYQEAGIKIPEEKLIEIGDIAGEKGFALKAMLSYREAGIKISEEKLIELGDIALKKGRTEDAVEAYPNTIMSKEKWIEIGEVALKNDNLRNATFAYDKAGSKEKLLEIGNLYVKKGNLEEAIQIFTALKNKTNLYS